MFHSSRAKIMMNFKSEKSESEGMSDERDLRQHVIKILEEVKYENACSSLQIFLEMTRKRQGSWPTRRNTREILRVPRELD